MDDVRQDTVGWHQRVRPVPGRAAMIIPSFPPDRTNSVRIACIANLRAIAGAKQTWADENQKGTNAIPTTNDLFGPTLYIKEMPVCPLGGTYTLKPVAQNPTCPIHDHTL